MWSVEAGWRRLEWALGVEPGSPLSEPPRGPQAHRYSGRPPHVPGGTAGQWPGPGQSSTAWEPGELAQPTRGRAALLACRAETWSLGEAAAAGWGSCLSPHGAGATPSTPAQPAREARPLQNTAPAASLGAATRGSRSWSLACQAPLPSRLCRDSSVPATRTVSLGGPVGLPTAISSHAPGEGSARRPARGSGHSSWTPGLQAQASFWAKCRREWTGHGGVELGADPSPTQARLPPRVVAVRTA